MKKVIIGIDIAKDTLAIALRDQQEGRFIKQCTLPNTRQGHHRLITLVQHYDSVHCVMEATGNYHLHLVKALDQAGIKQSVINPLQLKRFVQMKLRRIKTDRSDAQLLAEYGCEQKPSLHVVPTVVQQQLKQINSQIALYKKIRTALMNATHANRYVPECDATCGKTLKKHIKQLEATLKQLEDRQEELIGQAYATERTLIESVPGVGPRTSRVLLAYLGSFSSFAHHQQVAAYMGLNPVPVVSGTSLNQRMHISKQGNASLRCLFYMCALSAKRHNKVCRALYERMRAAGKPEKVALIAVANKLVKQVFTVVKKGVMFDNEYLEKALQRG